MQSILFILVCAGTLFVSSSHFIDSQIMPKWYIMIFGLLLLCGYHMILFLVKSDKAIGNNTIKIYKMMGIIVFVVLLQTFYGICQYIGVLSSTSNFPVTGSFDNPAGFAACLCVGFPFYLWGIERTQGIIHFFIVLATVLVILAVISSESRTGIVSLIAVVIFWGVKRVPVRFKLKWCLSICLLLLSIIGLYFLKKDSADGRLFIWRCAGQMLSENPMTGYGAGGFEAHYMDYQAEYFRDNLDSPYSLLADNVQYPFCEYIRIGVDYGVLGLLLLVFLLGILFYSYFKHPSKENETAILCWVSMGTFSTFSYPSMYSFVWLVLLFSGFILVRGCFSKIVDIPLIWLKFGTVVGLIFCFYIGWKTCQRMEAEIEWKQISTLSLFGKTKQVLPQYRMLKEELGNDRYFLYNYSVELYKAKHYNESLTVAKECRRLWADYDLEMLMGQILEKLERYNEAESHYQLASLMCPNRFIPLYRLVLLLDKIDRKKDANAIARIIINKPEKFSSLLIDGIKIEMNKYIE